MSPRRLRVLFAQRPQGGGSLHSLLDLLGGLLEPPFDAAFEPLVLFPEEGDGAARVRELGLEVLVEGPARPAAGSHDGFGQALRMRLRRIDTLREASNLMRRQLPAARRVARLIRAESVDLVHANTSPRGDRVPILGGRLAAVPVVCHVRTFVEYQKPIDPWVARLPRRFVFVSRAMERYCRSALGIAEDRCVVLHDAVELGRFEGMGGSALRVRAELGVGPEEPVVCNVGRLVRWKGQDVFLEAMERMLHAVPDLHVLIVGPAAPEPESLAFERRLREMADSPLLRGHVRFLGHRGDIPAVMAASDVVVHSAVTPEPFGRVIVEAMAAGTPLVAAAAGGVVELVDDGRTGLLVPPGEVAPLAEAVSSLLHDPERGRQMAERAARGLPERFGPERFTRALAGVYADVLRASSRAGLPHVAPYLRGSLASQRTAAVPER